MALYLVNHKHGCGCEEIEADSPEQAIEIRRSQLTEREAGYQMFATLAEVEQATHSNETESSFRQILDKIESLNDPESNGYCEQDAYEEQDNLASVMIERIHSNAALYDAAPELLEALQCMLIYLGDWDSDDETCVAAKAAIAKATGK